MDGKPKIRRGVVRIVGFVALAALPVLALNSLATAAVTLPAKPADGSRPEFTQEQRDALRQAAEACGLPAGPRGMHGPGPGPGTV